jgi:hypothetical protein
VNEVPVADTQFSFRGVDSNLLIAKAIEHSTCVIEKLWIRFAVDKYLVDLDLAYFVDEAVKDLILQTALKLRASSFQSHGNSVPLL